MKELIEEEAHEGIQVQGAELAQFVPQELQSGAFHTEDELVAAALMAYQAAP